MKIPYLSIGRTISSICCLILSCQAFAQADSASPGISNGEISLSLPAGAGTDTLTWLEQSTDLVNWEPVARDYGFDWENTFPHQVDITGDAGNQVFSKIIGGQTLYFRMVAANTSPLSNKEAVSRFLQQATFGPSKAKIDAFPGVNEPDFQSDPYTYFEQWIDAQIAKPVFSHRRFFRQRSNPAFVDNTGSNPDEVGFIAPTTELTYYTSGNIKNGPSTSDALNAGRSSNDVTFSNASTKKIVWYQGAIAGQDELRQRVAWALSQIFVLGESGSNQTQTTERFVSYYDIFVNNAFGNYRDILEEVTFHPSMGYYLTYVDNKAFHVKQTYPDENYAREIMQLYSIGLWMMNQDGSLQLDGNGDPIPTYDNDDITEFAKIFTGMRRQNADANIEYIADSTTRANYVDPMVMQASWHDFTEKTLLDGSTIGPYSANSAGGIQEINDFLDHLHNHQNTAPFISKILIQRLTVSNPSPNYIEAVSTAFETGLYKGVGTGIRGDLTAVIKAIMLHPEAREPSLSFDDSHGKLREPLIRFLHFARTFEITSPQTYGFFPFDALDGVFAQAPYKSPSVFNFYKPEYQPIGDILDRGVYAPEFQIHTDVTSISLINAIHTLIHSGITDLIGQRNYSQGDLNLTYETDLAGTDISALVDHLDLVLCGGRLTDANREILITHLSSMPGNSNEKAKKALYLFCLLPEFNIIF